MNGFLPTYIDLLGPIWAIGSLCPDPGNVIFSTPGLLWLNSMFEPDSVQFTQYRQPLMQSVALRADGAHNTSSI